jgi:SAM-dependent methyltransferase
MTFKDHFSDRAERYAEFRPHYPASLFQYLATLVNAHSLAWDCATGNGQAAEGLAHHFRNVVATDASKKQIRHAEPHEHVDYCVALAEQPPLRSGTVEIVTVAQALHWLHPERFFPVVERVLKPGGIFAAWCYNLLHVDAHIDAIVLHLYVDVVGPYWAPERLLVEQGYRSIALPFVEVPTPKSEMEAQWDLADLIGYIGTWSASQKYAQARHADPVDEVRADLHKAWGDPQVQKKVVWPLNFRIGRKA